MYNFFELFTISIKDNENVSSSFSLLLYSFRFASKKKTDTSHVYREFQSTE